MATDHATGHDAVWSRASAVVAQRFGLDFPPARHGDLQRGLNGAAAELGLPDAAACTGVPQPTPKSVPSCSL